MAHIIGVVSQKGGVGKSTLTRLVAREFAQQGWDVKIADLDVSQGTCVEWGRIRQKNGIAPLIRVESFGRLEPALADAERFDLVIIDGAPHATAMTLDIAPVCDLVVIPTGLSLDDLRPGVVLAHELVRKGIPSDKLVFVLARIGESANAIEDARRFVVQAGYDVAQHELPDRIGYQRAMNGGLAASESAHRTLNEKAEAVAQDIADRLTTLVSRREVA
ncbi:ParA family protein [Lutibaculum baratangense]|uniref:ParA family protein n=1 Tax=Lutibaculum baratangense TaxID=1358440 RepID=UPI00058EE731|nr:ParA family protein [Lutibaculum baratangense]